MHGTCNRRSLFPVCYAYVCLHALLLALEDSSWSEQQMRLSWWLSHRECEVCRNDVW